MAESEQGTATLQKLWKGGRVGYLSAFEQMKALVYREVLKAENQKIIENHR